MTCTTYLLHTGGRVVELDRERAALHSRRGRRVTARTEGSA
jgi:hypothetical protein